MAHDIVCLGLNYKTATVERRERAAMTPETQAHILKMAAAGEYAALGELAILSTCNRVELYGVGQPEAAFESLRSILLTHSHIAEDELHASAYYLQGEACALHLFRVAAGLDSLAVGEPQILGQLVRAYEQAHHHGAAKTTLSALMQRAIRAGKRPRHETSLGSGAFSISAIVARHAERITGKLTEKAALVIGAGKMARAAVNALAARGLGRLIVANRTPEKARLIAGQGKVIGLGEIWQTLEAVDIVITAATTTQTLLKGPDVAATLANRAGNPLLLFDIALPRNVDSHVGEIPGVCLYNLDDLQAIADVYRAQRQNAIPQAEQIICEALAAFTRWQAERAAVPAIRAIRRAAEAALEAEWEHLPSDLGASKRLRLEAFSRRLVNNALHRQIIALKESYAQVSGIA